MKPIAIFRHSPGEGPGYFATFLDRHSLPWKLFKVDEGVSPPPTIRGIFRALLHGRADERE
jgi:hypothetical protein